MNQKENGFIKNSNKYNGNIKKNKKNYYKMQKAPPKGLAFVW